jgi:hypothetical protein
MEWLRNIFRKRLPEKRILMYGLQRSGTNYMETLMQLNYPDAKFLNGIVRSEITHKHFRLYPEKAIIPEPQFANTLQVGDLRTFESHLPFPSPDLYIIVSKDPFSWLISYQKWSRKNNWPHHEHHYISEYVLFYGMWKQFALTSDKIIFVRYDDLLIEPKITLDKVATLLNWPLREHMHTTNKVYASRRFSSDKKQAHLSGEHLKSIPSDELHTINALLPDELLKFLGYERVVGSE